MDAPWTFGRSLRRVGVAATSGFIVLVLGLTLATGEANRGERPTLPFRVAAWGVAGLESQRWVLDPGTRSLGLIAAVATCDDEALLVDTASRAVHRFSLPDGRYVDSLGPRADGTSALQFPTGLALDCTARVASVVDHGLLRFDLDSRELIDTFAMPETFVAGLGPIVSDDRALYVSGLWTPVKHDWLGKSLAGLFQSDHLGWRLDLATGASSPMFPALEHGCASVVPDCLAVKLDRVRSPRREAWVAAHAVSGQVGVFDESYRLIRTIDVRSPFFYEDGTAVTQRAAAVERQMAWSETNSVIRGVYVFDDVVVTIHTVQATKNWKKGQPLDFEVFMNVHSLVGEGLLADVRLPDLPVGRDERHLFVVDYGGGGRRRVGRGPVTLIAIPIAETRRLFR